MKKTDNVLKQFLHLNEDYTLDLDKDKGEDQLILEAEGNPEDSEETNDNASEEANDDESKADSKESSSKSSDDSSEEPKEAEKKINSENKKIKYSISISDIYSKMQAAKTPSEVALILKAFLERVEQSSLNALTQAD